MGAVGWAGVIGIVVAADALAKARKCPTLSDLFARHKYWFAPAWAAVTMHLLLHEEQS